MTAAVPENSIGPLPLEPQRSGPGHYTVQGALLGVAGRLAARGDHARLRLRRVHGARSRCRSDDQLRQPSNERKQ